MAETLSLSPGRWTAIPQTNLVILWLGTDGVAISRIGGVWNLARLAVPGRVVAWVTFADRPDVAPWPIVPLASRATYRSRAATDSMPADTAIAELAREQWVRPVRSTEELTEPGLSDSKRELDEFLVDLYVSRRGTS
jgi:hypothetical protein